MAGRVSRERELLKRWFSEFGRICCNKNLLIETKELLAQPEHMGGVTAMVERKQPLSELININKEWYQIGYEAAKRELEREPLSEQEIGNICKDHFWVASLTALARAIEKAHGIGGE